MFIGVATNTHRATEITVYRSTNWTKYRVKEIKRDIDTRRRGKINGLSRCYLSADNMYVRWPLAYPERRDATST